ncbi:COG3014 family protein [Shewanella sp. GXUN23E]|uniref:COG3014 family protein n=1 Tax=Shewanella sp. GXUN23E TaxID=3422498 RepID=UPI003D7CF89A
MLKLRILLVSLSLLLGGCAGSSLFVSYPSQMASVRQALNSATPASALPSLQAGLDGQDALLYAQEAGRVAQINGDFKTSENYYRQAMADYQAQDGKAIISASDIGATASGILLNDNAIPYRGPAFERIMLHQYQALNFLFTGDYQAALVEVRRTNELQAQEQQRFESKSVVQDIENGQVAAEMRRLGQVAGNLDNAFLNAYSYYVTGLIYELLGQPNDAFIDYRKAERLSPGNPYLQQTLVRLAKTLHMPQYQEFKQRWGDALLPRKNEGQLILLLERGLVPAKQSFTVPFTIDGYWQRVTLPTYSGRNPQVPSATISGAGKPLKTAPLANLDAMAINALRQQMPAILLRQGARVAAKAEMNRQAGGKHNQYQDNVGAVAMELFNLVSEQADRRSWLTLPQQAQIASESLPAGSYPVRLDNSPPHQITIEAGKTTLVWAIDTGNLIRFYSIII